METNPVASHDAIILSRCVAIKIRASRYLMMERTHAVQTVMLKIFANLREAYQGEKRG